MLKKLLIPSNHSLGLPTGRPQAISFAASLVQKWRKGFVLSLSMLLLAALGLFSACSSDHEHTDWNDRPLMKVYVYLPEAPSLQRDVTDNIASDLLPEENVIKTLDVWVFDRTENKLLGHTQERDVVLSGGAKEINIALDITGTASEMATQLATLRSHRADVYAIVNQGSVGLTYNESTAKATIAATSFSGDYFGVKSDGGNYVPTHPASTDDKSALSEGLPMAGRAENVALGGEGRIVTIEQIQLYRAVSKLRCVFTRQASMTNAAIKSISLTGGKKSGTDGGHIAVTENLFGTDSEASISGGYVSNPIYLGALTNSEIATHRDPLALVWRTDTNDKQTYETRINDAIKDGMATEVGRCYLRETDRQLHGTITYTLDGTTEKTMEFTMAAENDFVRNHAWTILGYFYNGELQLRLVVDNWNTWTENISYQDEVTVTEQINWDEETIAGEPEIIYNSETGLYEKSIVTLIPNTDAVCYFAFNTPVSGTWYATLETVSGTGSFGAIVFDDDTEEGTLTMSGPVGPRCALRIRAVNPNPEHRNRARIVFSVRNQADETIPVKSSVMGANIEILQPIN